MRILSTRPARKSGGRRRRRGGRAVTMLEFALILPVFMYMLLFIVDMGYLVLVTGAMDDATYSAARTGAQLGGAGYPGQQDGNVYQCGASNSAGNHQACSNGAAYNSLTDAISEIPGYTTDGTGKVVLDPSKGMVVQSGVVCSGATPNDHVVLKVHYHAKLLTPGLGAMLSLFNHGNDGGQDNAISLTATAVARCQVVRTP